MDTEEPKDDQRRKRHRSRVRLDWLKAEWSPATGFTLTGVGLIGVAVVVVVWLTTGHQARAKLPNPSDGPATTSSAPSNNSHPPVTTPSTTTITRPTTTTGTQSTSRIPSHTTQSTSTATRQPTDLVPGVSGPAVQLGSGWVEPDPQHQECETGYQFNFFQEITMSHPGTVTYKWERSDGGSQGQLSTLVFSDPGTKTVTNYWQRWGDPGTELAGDEWIHIVSPIDLVAEKAKDQWIHFSYECPIPLG